MKLRSITLTLLAFLAALPLAFSATKSKKKNSAPSASDIIPTPIEIQQKKRRRPQYRQPLDVSDRQPSPTILPLEPGKGERIVFIGNGLAERMQHFGHFETLLVKAFPKSEITFRNMGYNGKSAPRLVLVTPIAAEDHPDYHLPDAAGRTVVLAAYAVAVETVAAEKNVGFIDLFSHTQERFRGTAASGPLTINGIHLGATRLRSPPLRHLPGKDYPLPLRQTIEHQLDNC